jgi:nucleotide-binding universal stress UspA family protein
MNLILVPLDTSEVSAEAIEPAMRLAEALDSKLLLLTVGDVVVKNAMIDLMDSERITAEQALQLYLAEQVSDLEGRGVDIETLVIDSRDPAAAIADTAEARDVDMIVMCTHGRSGAARWLLGSTADRVVRSANVPVHLIPVR